MKSDINPEDEHALRALDADRLKKLREQRGVVQKELLERESKLRQIDDQIKAFQTILGDYDDAEPKLEQTTIETLPKSITTAPLEVAYQVLKERSPADMHYRDLAEEVVKRGGRLPSSDQGALLNTRLTSDKKKRFVRPHQRGCYALREDYPDLERSVGERQSRQPAIK